MLVAALALAALLAFGPQAVLCNFLTITFSPIAQCGAFNVSFVGGKPPSALPLALTVLPFNSTSPISIPIPETAWNNVTSTGAFVTFLPLSAGTTFLASLDDANGNGAASVSDIIRISPSDNTSCLATTTPSTTKPLFTLASPVGQCLPFNVSFDTTVDSQPPSVRAFVRKGSSFRVQPQAIANPPGVGTYLMTAVRTQEMALLFADSKGNRQISDVLTVQGDTSSSTSCFNFTTPATPVGSARSTSGLSRSTVVAIVATCAVILGVITLLVVVWVRREARRRAVTLDKGISSANIEAAMPPPQEKPYRYNFAAPEPAQLRPDPPQQGRYLMDPPYPTDQYSSLSPSSDSPRSNNAGERSRLQLPADAQPGRLGRSLTASVTPSTRPVSSLDIEGILETAEARSPSEAQYALASPRSAYLSPRSPPTTGRSPGQLGSRSTQALDVPLSATPSGRFSGMSAVSQGDPRAAAQPVLARGNSAGNPFIESGGGRAR